MAIATTAKKAPSASHKGALSLEGLRDLKLESPFAEKISARDQIFFTNQLSLMLEIGTPLNQSLSVIARRYRVSVRDLQRWNNISDPRGLRAGTNITVFHSPAQPNPTASGSVKYVVQRGDSLWKIAQKYKVEVKDLKTWNDLGGSSTLQPGQSIRIEL